MYLVALLVAAAPTVAAIVTFALSRRKLADVHQIVNSQRDAMLAEIAGLREDLARAGVTPTTKPGGGE